MKTALSAHTVTQSGFVWVQNGPDAFYPKVAQFYQAERLSYNLAETVKIHLMLESVLAPMRKVVKYTKTFASWKAPYRIRAIDHL